MPLYVEELTKTLLESSDEAGVPASLKDSLMARLDRLGPAKELAQIASVIGRAFSFDALSSLAEWSEADLEHGLEGLVGSGLVHRRGEESFEFKHALVRDAAYDSMLRDTRRGFHGRFAKHLMVNRQGESQPELLAHHQQEAALYDSAAQHWLRAGEHAAMRGANREAIAHLRTGLASVAELGISERGRELELSLLSTLGPVMMQTFGYGAPDVGETYEQFRNLARSEVGTTAKWFEATFGLWLHSQGRAEFSRARELIEELFELCDAAPDESHRIQAQHAAWTTGLNTGEFASSHNFAKDAIELYRPEEHGRHYLTYAGHDPCACAHIHNAMALWFLGYPERAVHQAKLSLERANELSHPSSMIVSRFFGLLLRQYAQDAERVRTDAEAMIELTKAHGPATWLAASRVLLGWAIAALGDPTKGYSISQSGLCDYQATGNIVRDAYYRALHVDVCLMDGRLDEGAACAEEALAVSDRTGDTHWDAEIHRLAGELCCKRGDSERGGEHLRRAVSIARTQDARILELRARLSLWRHTDSEPDRKLVHGELDRLYSSFDEGHQTKDLMAARQVLNSPPL